MTKRTYTWQGVEITLRSPTIRDRLNYDVAYMRLFKELAPGDPVWLSQEYAHFLTSLDSVKGDLPFVVPQPTSTADDLIAGREAWLNADGDFYEQWQKEYALTQATPNAEALQPVIDPNV